MNTEPSAKIIADSISPSSHRLTTMEITCHRFVLAEFNTHRVFSRNSASSRAIPVSKQLEKVKNDPAYPLSWPSEQKGMQGGGELTLNDLQNAQKMWDMVRWGTINQVEMYLKVAGGFEGASVLHKSLLNRLLEPFMWHTIIVSSTEWENFFKQRCSPLAQPEIRVVAEKMREVLENSRPTDLEYTEWHMPYIDDAWIPGDPVPENVDLRHVSAARCARVSYLTHDGVRDMEVDEGLYQKLISADPPHASPLEHVATPIEPASKDGWYLDNQPFTPGNFTGWAQLRHQVLG